MYKRFGLTLMVTQDCNLACDYCYIGHKSGCIMPLETGKAAIDRAAGSVEPGGVLELGYFGGEPFLVPDLLTDLSRHANTEAGNAGFQLVISITTNGTVLNDKALAIMTDSQVDVTFSIDGRKETHDLHRHFMGGKGSFDIVCENYQRLLANGKKVRAVTVVSPTTAGQIDLEVLALRKIGCKEIELSLDLWSHWDNAAMDALQGAIGRCAQLWADGLPQYRLNWFDEKAAALADVAKPQFRCGFGKGDIAVSPAGNLYPCERLIGDDGPDNAVRLPGRADDGKDFLFGKPCEVRQAGECMDCGIKDQCNTDCGCCNYARSGCAARPDKLLCLFNQWCLQETKNVLNKIIVHDERS